MKKVIQFFFYFIFVTFCAQEGEKIGIELQINNEMDKAENLAINNIQNTLEMFERTYHLSKNINNRSGMLKSNSILMKKYFDTGNFQKVIDLSKEAETLAIEVSDNELLYQAFSLRASSYKKLGHSSTSRTEFLKAYEVAKKIDSKNYKNYKNYQRSHIYHGSLSYLSDINRDTKTGGTLFKNISQEKKNYKNTRKTELVLTFIIISLSLCFWILWRRNQNKIIKGF